MKRTQTEILLKRAVVSLLIISASLIDAKAQTITVDNYFNNETKKDKSGQTIKFHYLWEDTASTGFSIFGKAFKDQGAKELKTLSIQPTFGNLKGTDVYIIVDPDNLKDNPNPNYVGDADVTEISKWVKAGGVLLLLANDKANADLEHFNKLSQAFGITFNQDLILHVTDDAHFANGGLNTVGTTLFKQSKRIFLKDVCSITTKAPAKAIIKDANGANVIVSAKYGKGTVLAVGDPWLYNEYTNGRLPAEYQNNLAAQDVAAWLIGQIPKKK